MRRLAITSCLALVLAGGLALAPAASAQERKADVVLKEINTVELPKFDPAKRNDQAAMMQYFQKRQEAMAKKADLIGELYKVDPTNAKLTELLPERWQSIMMSGPAKAKDLKAELKDIKTNAKTDKLKTDAAYWTAIITLQSGMMGQKAEPKELVGAAEDFIKVAPKDERGAVLLYSVGNQITDSDEQTKLYKRVVKDYPESRVAKMVQGSLKQLENVGKPFELEFSDAIKGTTVSTKTLKGKVVVVDFWATWCGPCVAEMPNMKKLYAEYKDKGVEFVGISLDQPKEQGGLDKLKEFVKENEITWPQFYQGNGWQSEFSSSWGINSIPCVFVVDAQGKLHSVNARGKLETMIPELLKKSKSDAGAGAGAGGN